MLLWICIARPLFALGRQRHEMWRVEGVVFNRKRLPKIAESCCSVLDGCIAGSLDGQLPAAMLLFTVQERRLWASRCVPHAACHASWG